MKRRVFGLQQRKLTSKNMVRLRKNEIRPISKNVGVSAEELTEILQDINISLEDPESDLTPEQIAAVCDELGYSSIEEAQEDNHSDISNSSVNIF